jgi:RNA-splicing ligase RtcB
VHAKQHDNCDALEELVCADNVDIQRALLSIGTLGGGNHFIEVNKSVESDDYWLVIHSGSRKLGLEIAAHYQNIAVDTCADKIQKDLRYLTGQDKDNYLHDMHIAQNYADLNRRIMASRIMRGMKWDDLAFGFTTTHNYIDFSGNVLRKGAVSAKSGELLLIPLNMRDGLLVCKGKGNPEWNYSAPHGAGRLYSRSEARKQFTVEEYAEEMKGIFSTCINRSTIDEAPFAYKDYKEIMECIEPTVDILDRLIPIFNFKASD